MVEHEKCFRKKYEESMEGKNQETAEITAGESDLTKI